MFFCQPQILRIESSSCLNEYHECSLRKAELNKIFCPADSFADLKQALDTEMAISDKSSNYLARQGLPERQQKCDEKVRSASNSYQKKTFLYYHALFRSYFILKNPPFAPDNLQ